MNASHKPPDWTRPPGLARGTWHYVHERSIARHYQDFVAETPLCRLDVEYVLSRLTPKGVAREQREPERECPEKSADVRECDSPQPLVLDFGCGNGRVSLPLSSAGFRVLAVDLSQPMLEELVRIQSQSVADTVTEVMPLRANLVQLDGLRTAIADHAVCLFSTLGMIRGQQHRIEFLRHARRIVRPGGSMVLHVHRKWAALREPGGWRKLASDAWRAFHTSDHEFGDSYYAYRGLEDMFLHRFSVSEMNRLLRESGWTTRQLDWISEDGRQLTRSSRKSSGFFIVAT